MQDNLMSPSINELAAALAKAQAEFNIAGKNQKNPFFKSTYADFESIINASRPALTKYGLSVVQAPSIKDQDAFLITVLMHSSGQWVQSIARYNPAKSDIQSLSSYNTYLKRMCYTSLIGVVVGEEDDDGEKAVAYSRQPNSIYNERSFSGQLEDEVITKEQLEAIEDLLMGHPDICQNIFNTLRINSLSQMPKKIYLGSCKRIQELIKAKGN